MENCSKKYDLISFVEGTMNISLKSEFELHLATCPKCAVELKIIEKALRLIEKQKSLPENQFLFTRISHKLEQRKAQTEKIRRRVLQPVFIFSIVIASVLGGYFMSGLMNQNNKKQNLEFSYYVVQDPTETNLLNY